MVGEVSNVLAGFAGGGVGAWIEHQRGKRKARVIVAAKTVDNRTMPNYTRAERRAHKRRKRV